jgi:hypothetical protein
VGTVKVPLLEPADIVTLPKGQAFALIEGGQLWKIRMGMPMDFDDDIPFVGWGYGTGKSTIYVF